VSLQKRESAETRGSTFGTIGFDKAPGFHFGKGARANFDYIVSATHQAGLALPALRQPAPTMLSSVKALCPLILVVSPTGRIGLRTFLFCLG
jgi:hypothetical protein